MLSIKNPADPNFTSVDSALAAADRLCETANRVGIFLREGDPERDAATCKAVRRTAKDWLRTVRKHLDGKSSMNDSSGKTVIASEHGKSTITVADALRLMPSYDILHRVAYGTPADPAFLNRHVMAAFESRIRGNKEVDPYILYRQINAGISRRDPLYLGRPLAWSTAMLDRWYKELSGYTQNTKSIYDQLQVATILMESDLWAYEGTDQRAFKIQIFERFHPLFYDTAGYDLKSKSALNSFLLSSRRYLSRDLFDKLRKALQGHKAA